jgi:hypothetical protein
MTSRHSPWTRAALTRAGFVGWVPPERLTTRGVSREPGVYVIWRESVAAPEFLERSRGGIVKGGEPTVPVERLAANWVPGASVLYIGKASPRASGRPALAHRLGQYRRFGAGLPVDHWGGRMVWQLADHAELLVAWRPTAPEDPEEVETAMIDAFEAHHGRLPFANLRRGRRFAPPSEVR